MKQGCSKHIFSGVSSVMMAGIFACPAAHASTSPTQNDLIVRMNRPAHKSSMVKVVNSLSSGAPQVVPHVHIINKKEGLVQFRFANSTEAEIAKQILVHTDAVQSVVPNFLYHPEVIYQANRIVQKTTPPYILWQAGMGGFEKFAKTFLGHPKKDDFNHDNGDDDMTIPDVALPPTDVEVGDDPYESQDLSMAQINMPSVDQVSDIQTDAVPLTVAVIDTGVDYNHEDLSGAMWRSPDNQEIVGYDFAHQTATPYDVRHFDMDGCLGDPSCYLGLNPGTNGDPSTQDGSPYLTNPGHGTHCAGHIGAVAGNSLGIRGTGGNVQIMALKFVHDAGEPDAGEGDDVAAIQSIDYAIKKGAKIINASWGNREARAGAEKSELKAALIRAQQAGLLVITAAGNDAINQDTDKNPVYPAAYANELDNIIVVAATDSANRLASFSNFGASSVQIAAPGVKIFSTTPEATDGTIYNDVIVTYQASASQNFEIDWNGTSMAAPFVAGAAALVWSKYPDENYLQIKNRILAAAKPVATLRGKLATGGVLDVSASLGLVSN